MWVRMSSAGADRGVLLHPEKCAERTGLIFSGSDVVINMKERVILGLQSTQMLEYIITHMAVLLGFLMEMYNSLNFPARNERV